MPTKTTIKCPNCHTQIDVNEIIRNWLRNRNTIEFLGVWEKIYNPNFKTVEFDGFKKEAVLI
jgi:hypothetical protein